MCSQYGIPITVVDVPHVPTAIAFDFWMLILAPDADVYWSSISRSLGTSSGDVIKSVIRTAYATMADFLSPRLIRIPLSVASIAHSRV
jgi:hypothetical protein